MRSVFFMPSRVRITKTLVFDTRTCYNTANITDYSSGGVAHFLTDSELLQSIFRRIENGGKDIVPYHDALSCIRNIGGDTVEVEKAHRLRDLIRKAMQTYRDNPKFMGELYRAYKYTLCYTASEWFDDYMIYVEMDRAPEKQFYIPRRRYLFPLVQAYQDVADGKLKLLTVSLVKRGGKSQTGINFVNFMSGRHPDRSTLMEGTGDDLVKSFYLGCLEYLQQPNDYLFYDVFPHSQLVQQNADTKIINLNEKSRFPTIMCRSIDARQVGLSEATNVLYLDDCVEGREEAKNRDLMDKKWEIISGDIIGRAIEGTPIVATGTRYSLYDPIGRLQEEARAQKWKWRALELPALDPVTDESNYEYFNPKIGAIVFSTAFFKEQRAMLSAEQWESEFQQQPFEAKGLLFPEDRLNRYFQLPVDREPDAVIAVCDTAESGSDSLAMGIFKIYGEDVFLDDVVFDNSPAEITKPQCAKKIYEHNVSTAVFESNLAGTYFARDVEEMVKQLGGKVSIRTKRTVTNKQTRIEFASDGILKHFFFLDRSLYTPTSQYGQFIKELVTYTRTGRVPHDDAADMTALAEGELRSIFGGKVEIIRSPFRR